MNLHSSRDHDRQILSTASDIHGSNKVSAHERKNSHLQGEGKPTRSPAQASSLLSSYFG